MDGMPYYSKSKVSVGAVTRQVLEMPSYLRNGIGKYGSEIAGTLDTSTEGSVETLRKYIETLNLPTHKTFHTFEDYVPPSEHEAIQHIKYSNLFVQISKTYPGHFIVPIITMNELYVSCLGADGSDRVFETPHIDGLFAWFPWCNVLRAVVAIQGNSNIQTIFPLSQNTYTLETGEYVAFDYNRSVHYIYGTEGTKDTEGTKETKEKIDPRTRIILKLHYLAYPEWLPLWISVVYVNIHGRYNAFLRGLFLQSQITPTLENAMIETPSPTVLQKCISSFINNSTTIYVKIFLICLFLSRLINRLFSCNTNV